MTEPLSYHVFYLGKWLADDEHSWTPDFAGSAAFTTWELADDIGKRELGDGAAFYVFACMPSR